MAANFSAASKVFVAGITSGHIWGSENTMFGQDEGISPDNSGRFGVFATWAKNASSVAKVNRAALVPLFKVPMFSISFSLGAHRSVPQCMRMGPSVVDAT